PPPRILPDGCVDLLWSDRIGLLVAGPDTVAQVAPVASGRWVGLRFAPGAGPVALGVPGHELRDRRVPLDQLWPEREVRQLTERLASGESPGRLLESVAADRLRTAGGPEPLAAAVVDRLVGGESVARTAAAVGLGPRALHRRCRTLFGYGPKTLARILRMRHALALARSGVPAVQVAVRAGYADQAHLCREVRSLAGVPLGALTR
ncbi:MAG TPA: helix-turn-helix transcriptional regulator, partial [Micromonospora sp.]